MTRFLLFLITALLALLLTAPAASAFDWKDVAKMREAGIADSLILQKIEYSGAIFHLNAEEMEALKEAGVSDEVISAMLRTEAEEGAAYDNGQRYDRAYDESPYDYYHYPHSRLYVGFGYGYYGPWPWYYDRYDGYPWYGGYYGRVHYRYPRSYFKRYSGYRPYSGRYGRYGRPGPEPTRYRTRVEGRIGAPRGGYTGYRTRTGTGTPRVGTSRTGTNRGGSSGPSRTRVRSR